MGHFAHDGREAEVIRLADEQFGLVRRDQLLDLGFGPGAVRHRVRTGRLHVVHPGVLSVGHHVLPQEGRHLAATWWAGAGAVLSHESAAWFHRLVDEPPAEVHLTLARYRRATPGVVAHRTEGLVPQDVLPFVPVAVTSRARTLADCAAVVSPAALRAMADRLRALPVAELRDLLGRPPGRRGARALRGLVDGAEAHTRSAFERRYLRRAVGVRRPDRLNEMVAGHRADLVWDAERVVVELDGRGVHQRAATMAADRRKDADYQRAGWFIRRLVWEDLDAPRLPGTLAELSAVLVERARGDA